MAFIRMSALFRIERNILRVILESVINRGWDFQKFITFLSRLIKFNGRSHIVYLLSNCQNIYLTGARFTPLINKWCEIYDRKTTDLLFKSLKRAINLTWRDSEETSSFVEHVNWNPNLCHTEC